MSLYDLLYNNDNVSFELVAFIVILVLVWILTQINRLAFIRIRKRQKGLHLLFYERVISAILVVIGVILAFSVFGGVSSIWKSLLGGTAIVSAVLAFAAQDAIKDILAGLMISLYKPFEVGNRVELEDGTAGVVEDLTMRHVVMRVMDTQRLIIPNSKLNAMSLKNFSYNSDICSRQFNFDVGYNTNVEEAMFVIREAIIQSEFTVPGKKTLVGLEYSPVYFFSFEGSSLRLTTTVYFPPSITSEIVISDINLRVNHALQEHNIEIPYQYINILQPSDESTSEDASFRFDYEKNAYAAPDIVVDTHGIGMQKAIDKTAAFCEHCGLEKKETLRMRLLSEELFGMMRGIVGSVNGHYWVDHDSDKSFAIHLRADVLMDREMRKQLLALSSTGQNAAAVGFIGRIRDLVDVLTLPKNAGERGNVALPPGLLVEKDSLTSSYVWSMNRYKADLKTNKRNTGTEEDWDELEKSIVASIADDVTISIEGTQVEIIIFKSF